MKFKTEGDPSLNVRETGIKSIAYTDEFKEIVATHPNLLNDSIVFFKQMTYETAEQMEKENKEVTIGDNTFWLNSYMEDGGRDVEQSGKTMTFRIKTKDGHDLFVKAIHKGEDGYEEIRSSEKMREMVKSFEKVRVVDYLAGYSDENNNSYFVSKWVNARFINSALDDLYREAYKLKINGKIQEAQVLEDKHAKLEKRFEDLKKAFEEDTYDFDFHNMFYDEETDEIILFDLHVF